MSGLRTIIAANTNDFGTEIHEQTISITVKLESWDYYCIAIYTTPPSLPTSLSNRHRNLPIIAICKSNSLSHKTSCQANSWKSKLWQWMGTMP
jgi:hypothetical protein